MNPETIRALLAGITAGSWSTEPDDEDDALWWVSVPDQPFDHEYKRDTAAFIAASPGIARYALELAERLAEYVQRDVCIWHSPPEVTDAGGHCRTERCRNARYALAPQPAPTDGAG